MAQRIKNCLKYERSGLIFGWRISPVEGNDYPLQYACLEFHGQRSLTSHNPWGYRESNVTERPILWFYEDVTHHKLNSSAAFFWNSWLVSRLTLDSLCDIHFYSAFPILAGKSHGWRYLVGPQGHRESDTTECVHTHPKWKSVFSIGTGFFFFFFLKVKSYLVGIFRTLSLGDSISVALRILQGSRRWLQAIYKFAAKRAGSLNIKDQISS